MQIYLSDKKVLKDIYLYHPQRGECSSEFIEYIMVKYNISPSIVRLDKEQMMRYSAKYLMTNEVYKVVYKIIMKLQDYYDCVEKDLMSVEQINQRMYSEHITYEESLVEVFDF